MRPFYAVDPGVRCTGWALFSAEGVLVSCGAVKSPKGQPVAEVAGLVSERLFGGCAPLPVVVELPQVYRSSRSKGDPNDLVAVATIAGAVAAQADRAVYVSPHQWKGSVPKAAQLSRYIVHRRNEKALDDAGCAAYRSGLAPWAASLRHNIADAVGIGLYALRVRLLDSANT